MSKVTTKLSSFLFLFIISLPVFIYAQSTASPKLLISLNESDWKYNINEPAIFTVKLENVEFNRGDSITISYAIGPEKMANTLQGSLKIGSSKKITIDGGTMKNPGFLRGTFGAKVGGKNIVSLATAAYEPEKLRPTNKLPDDFMDYWDKAKKAAAKVPMNARVSPWPEKTTETVKVFKVDFQSYQAGNRVYGILSVPNKPGKFPAILLVPGAGIRPYSGDQKLAEKGIITLQIGIHGIPVDLPAEVYSSLYEGALKGYPAFNLDDRDRYYYKRVNLGCVRANDFLVSLPEFDGLNLGVSGGSQGGALSIVTAALDSRVKVLRANYPALSDVTGYLHNRAGGWPHLFSGANASFNNKPERIENTQYYDVVNFARFVKIPGFYSWGFNDVTCPPTSMYAAYNMITAPKELLIVKETGHNTTPAQVEAYTDWLVKELVK